MTTSTPLPPVERGSRLLVSTIALPLRDLIFFALGALFIMACMRDGIL